jgi:hypothetical protein
MSDFLEAAEGKVIDAVYDARDQGRMMDDAGKEAMRATTESLRERAVERVLDEAENEGVDMHSDEARRYVDAVLGPEPETESDSPDASDIADMRYDEQRAAGKDESWPDLRTGKTFLKMSKMVCMWIAKVHNLKLWEHYGCHEDCAHEARFALLKYLDEVEPFVADALRYGLVDLYDPAKDPEWAGKLFRIDYPEAKSE